MTAYAKDGGIDLYAVRGDQTVAIQLKRRAANITEGVRAIREFIGAMVVRGQVNGLYCTTATRFTAPAMASVRSEHLQRFGIKLELMDYRKVAELFDLTAGKAMRP